MTMVVENRCGGKRSRASHRNLTEGEGARRRKGGVVLPEPDGLKADYGWKAVSEIAPKGGHSPPHLRLSAMAQNGAESSNSKRIGVRDLAALAGMDHFNPAAINA